MEFRVLFSAAHLSVGHQIVFQVNFMPKLMALCSSLIDFR